MSYEVGNTKADRELKSLPAKGMNDWEYWTTLVLEMDRMRVRERGNSCEERHAVSEINRAFSMKIVIENRKCCNNPAQKETEDIQSEYRI